MADGALNLKLSDYTASKIADKAKALGLPVEEVAVMLLDASVFDDDDFTWIDGDPRDDHASNHDLNEPGRLWSEVRPEMVAYLERKLAERK